MADTPTTYDIDGYVRHERLGRGDFAEVYRVSRDGKQYAMKICYDESERARERLAVEWEALRRLTHRGIPRAHEGGRYEGRPYIVMEMLQGAPLKQQLATKAGQGAVFGDVQVASALEQLLAVLVYMRGKNMVHRDIKSANVMVGSDFHVTLIDFGFCKRDGETDRRLDDSFWRAGAAAYSPPAKLANPARAVASHDVFAVGVLGYQMLTGSLPWDLGNGDIGALRRLQDEHAAQPVRDSNSRVDPELDQLILRMLELNDARRPDARTCSQYATPLHRRLKARGGARARATRLRYPHVLRDPVYGDVRLLQEEWTALASPQMQRLRWIRQLGLTFMVYPGADHSRFSHAIGCTHRVEQILRSIEDIEGVTIEPTTRIVARLYALVHDVTHIAFGHTLEDELGFFSRHDQNQPRAERLLLGDHSELGRHLRESEHGRIVLAHFDPEATVHNRSKIKDLVSSSTGADVLDYIDRDSLFCGLDHRVDSALFRQFRFRSAGDSQEERLVSLLYGSHGVRLDREYAVESLLTERYALYLKVYTHPDKVAASALLGKSLTAALYPPSGRPDFREAEVEMLADPVLIERLCRSRKTPARIAAERLVLGHIPRGVYRAPLLPEGHRSPAQYAARQEALRDEGVFDPQERQRVEMELARTARVDAQDVLVYCTPRAPGYSRVEHWISPTPGAARAVDHISGSYHRLAEKHLGLWELSVFTTREQQDEIARIAGAAEERFGFENRITVDRRSGRLF